MEQVPFTRSIFALNPHQTAIPTSGRASQDSRRFREMIEPTIALIRGSGDWNADMAQRRRVVHGFAWIIGDKRL